MSTAIKEMHNIAYFLYNIAIRISIGESKRKIDIVKAQLGSKFNEK
ncbi:hypothetical protein wNi1_05100 [Wolbachia pipientis]|nr:hypothetical protein [Wolbachia endosymbiont of Spodoptera picta]BDG76000.1 hypothetical protein wHmt_05580 [Wolbachia pipientis]BDG77460.1 hypothetical protein wHmc_05920 [Wolbachia pipientis]